MCKPCRFPKSCKMSMSFQNRLRYSRERALQSLGNHPPTLLNRINVCEYRLLVRVLRGGVVLNILRGVLVGVDLSRGYRREHVSGALAGGKPERRGNHGAHHPGTSWSLGFVQILAYMTSASALWNTLFPRHIRRLVRCIDADFFLSNTC